MQREEKTGQRCLGNTILRISHVYIMHIYTYIHVSTKEPWIPKKVQELWSAVLSYKASRGIIVCVALPFNTYEVLTLCHSGATYLDIACSINLLHPFASARITDSRTILGRHL